MSDRRTNAFYQSSGEAAMASSWEAAMVRSIAANSKGPKVVRVGETECFVVDYDKAEKRIFVYGKEDTGDCKFKLCLDEKETTRIIELLTKGKALF